MILPDVLKCLKENTLIYDTKDNEYYIIKEKNHVGYYVVKFSKTKDCLSITDFDKHLNLKFSYLQFNCSIIKIIKKPETDLKRNIILVLREDNIIELSPHTTTVKFSPYTLRFTLNDFNKFLDEKSI